MTNSHVVASLAMALLLREYGVREFPYEFSLMTGRDEMRCGDLSEGFLSSAVLGLESEDGQFQCPGEAPREFPCNLTSCAGDLRPR